MLQERLALDAAEPAKAERKNPLLTAEGPQSYPARTSPAPENTGRNEASGDFTPDFTPHDSATAELWEVWQMLDDDARADLLNAARAIQRHSAARCEP